jgi:thiaminase
MNLYLILCQGLPPHITLLKKLEDMEAVISAIVPEVHEIVPKLRQCITEEMENNAIAAGTITRQGLKEMLETLFNESGISAVVQSLESNRNTESDQPRNSSTSVSRLCILFYMYMLILALLDNNYSRHLYVEWIITYASRRFSISKRWWFDCLSILVSWRCKQRLSTTFTSPNIRYFN